MKRGSIPAALLLAILSVGFLVLARASNPPGAPADHFLAYKTKRSKGTAKFVPVRDMRLVDAFEDVHVDVTTTADLLVPADKNGEGISDAATHLRAYKIKAVKGSPKPAKHPETPVINQLGSFRLDLGKPSLLLVPTAKDLTAPPIAPDDSAHAVDRYKCYAAKTAKGSFKLPKDFTVGVADQFTSPPKQFLVQAPKHLCLPVDVNGRGVKNEGGELACYAVKPVKREPKHVPRKNVFLANELGSLVVDTVKETELCVPSVATVQATPTPTASATLTASSTPSRTATPSPTASAASPTSTPQGTGPTATPTPTPSGELPPDPASVAPPVDPSVPSSIAVTTTFLFDGADPIQTGVAPGTIDPRRTAIVRGRVFDGEGLPLPGVTVTIRAHPELGHTLTRTDGRFDLAVNGGGLLTMSYAKMGYLPAQRQLSVPWLDFAAAPDVILLQLDATVTTVDLAAAQTHVARGSVVSDDDGDRRATMIFPQGTSAALVMPGGATSPITSLSVRATEYTVGPDGPKAMPGDLPPTSAYTYAVELSVDEAIAAGAESVTFSPAVSVYVENFLGFPVGIDVPLGSYDRTHGIWIASESGRVVKIVGVTGNLADLDLDGDDVADDPATLGISDAERAAVANLYAVGQSLWRMPIPHFSAWDANWGFGPPGDAGFPGLGAGPGGGNGPGKVDNDSGCTRGCACQNDDPDMPCENETPGETVDVPNAPFDLRYDGDEVPGFAAANLIDITLSKASVSPSLKRIELTVSVAGQVFTQTFPPMPNLRTTFTWDGLDAYGRALQGMQPITTRVGYVYDGVYDETRRFGYNGGGNIAGSKTRQEVTLSQDQRYTDAGVGVVDARGRGLGGWSPTIHDVYDATAGLLYEGDGGRRHVQNVNDLVIVTRAGNGTGSVFDTPDGGQATDTPLSPNGVAVGADASMYVLDGTSRVRKIDPSGVVSTIAGGGFNGQGGDGGPATQATLTATSLARGSDGSIYLSDATTGRIRRIGPDGIIHTVAGGNGRGFTGDDGPATAAKIEAGTPHPAADGSFYFVNSGASGTRIRRVGPDGIISTVAGTGASCPFNTSCGNEGPATAATFEGLSDIEVAADGTIYALDGLRIRRITPDGIIHAFAGTGSPGTSGDGGQASQAPLSIAGRAIAIGPDGALYFTTNSNPNPTGATVRRIGPEGILSSVAGNGTAGFSGDGGPARAAQLPLPSGVSFGPDGNLYIADTNNHRVRRVAPRLPAFTAADVVIPSRDGTQLYQFDQSGRHLRTIHALTGADLFVFGYDGAGRLAQITDGDGNVTTIERDGSGAPTGILGADAQQTTVTLDPNGYLSGITNPANDGYAFTYSSDGLLMSKTTPANETSTYVYDARGRLAEFHDPAGGSRTYTRTETDASFDVTDTTALNRVSEFLVERLATGDRRLTATLPDTTKNRQVVGTDGSAVTTFADGTIGTLVEGPDPRFLMQAPVAASRKLQLPGGPTGTLTATRTATLADLGDPLSLVQLTDISTLNGKTSTRVYDAASRTFTDTSPVGRQVVTTIDVQGRPTSVQIGDLLPTILGYDARGRLESVTRGTGVDTRASTFAYDAAGNLATISDPMAQTAALTYDGAGRVVSITLGGEPVVALGWDGNGNLTSVTPPGRPAHALGYTPVGSYATYDAPPVVDGGTNTTTNGYDLDRALTGVTFPDGGTVGLDYDTAGRLDTVTLAAGTRTVGYDPTTGLVTSLTAPGNVGLAYTYAGPLATSVTWSGPVTGAVGRTYDTSFHVASLGVNGGNSITYQYDDDGLVTGAGALGLTRRAATGLLDSTALGDVSDAWTWNGFAEPTAYTATTSGGTLYASSYVYDKLGRITKRTESVGGGAAVVTEYGYDVQSHLTDVTIGGTSAVIYAYDANGNRSSADTGTLVTAMYDAQDRLLQYGTTTYTYGANGELASKTVGMATTTYAYDELGNLTGATLPGGPAITYVVDGENRRIGRRVGGTLQQGFLYEDDLRPIAELDGSNTVVSRFVYGSRRNVPDYMVKGGTTYRIVADLAGSPRLVVDTTTGAVAQRLDYDAFGNVVNDTSPGFQPFGFAGGLYDRDTKLVRLGSRDYDPATGRWTAKDPILFAGGAANLYAYASSDPVNLIDRDGRIPQRIVRFLGNKASGRTAKSLDQQAEDARRAWKSTADELTRYLNKCPKPTRTEAQQKKIDELDKLLAKEWNDYQNLKNIAAGSDAYDTAVDPVGAAADAATQKIRQGVRDAANALNRSLGLPPAYP